MSTFSLLSRWARFVKNVSSYAVEVKWSMIFGTVSGNVVQRGRSCSLYLLNASKMAKSQAQHDSVLVVGGI